MTPLFFSQGLWTLLFAYWIYSGRNNKATAAREPAAARLAHLTAIISGFYLLLGQRHFMSPFSDHYLPSTPWITALGLFVNALGVAFAIWARSTLGRNWSGAVTFKQDHQLIQTGPYRLVRHPIYTGIITGAVGTALVMNELRCLLGLVLIVGAYLVKIQKEEKLLGAHFSRNFDAYRASTKKLIPWIY